ncbi:hypothetical protein GALL_270860 [mine drainage metagenome]|uniref:Uncharacterized protein n=1 Tax=mine drainage metagenome TaxID=410659 RepID=A0A1J5RGA0_9ZZZZ
MLPPFAIARTPSPPQPSPCMGRGLTASPATRKRLGAHPQVRAAPLSSPPPRGGGRVGNPQVRAAPFSPPPPCGGGREGERFVHRLASVVHCGQPEKRQARPRACSRYSAPAPGVWADAVRGAGRTVVCCTTSGLQRGHAPPKPPARRVASRRGVCGVVEHRQGVSLACALRLASIPVWGQRGRRIA